MQHSMTRGIKDTPDQARRGEFDYVEIAYSPKQKTPNNGMLSPVEFKRQRQTVTGDVRKTREPSVG